MSGPDRELGSGESGSGELASRELADRKLENGELAGRTAVVTGSSSGVGRAIALELARAGADIVVHCRARQELAAQTADEIRALGRSALVMVADLSDPTTLIPLADIAWQWHEGVDIWVNNAGADVLTTEYRHRPFEEKLHILWRVDVLGTVQLSRRIGARMLERTHKRDATIVNIGWDQVEFGMGGDSGEMFSTIKGAVMAFTKSLARSLAPRVRVNCVAPGWIRTAWGATADDYWQQRAVGESLVQRWGEPADVARAVRFLASPTSSFITGQTLPVNGGYRTRGD